MKLHQLFLYMLVLLYYSACILLGAWGFILNLDKPAIAFCCCYAFCSGTGRLFKLMQ